MLTWTIVAATWIPFITLCIVMMRRFGEDRRQIAEARARSEARGAGRRRTVTGPLASLPSDRSYEERPEDPHMLSFGATPETLAPPRVPSFTPKELGEHTSSSFLASDAS